MNLVVIGCVHFLIFLNTILAQTATESDNQGTTTKPDDKVTTVHASSVPHGIQLKNFTELAHGLSSGPIIIVNKTTFFVPNLHYDGKGPDAHFWVGNGTMPNDQGKLVPDETGSEKSLKAYNGENVYITLPKGLTTDSIEYFGLWCIQYSHNFGYVEIPKNLKISESGKFTFRVQKCCPIDEIMDLNYKCIKQNETFTPKIDVRLGSNDNNLDYSPFSKNIDCTKAGKHFEKVDGASLSLNGSILKNHSSWNEGEYCLETCNINNETNPIWKEMAIICNGVTDISSISLNLLLFILSCKIILF